MHNLHGSPVFWAIGTIKVLVVVLAATAERATMVGCALDKTGVGTTLFGSNNKSKSLCTDGDCSSFVTTRSTFMI